MYTKRPALYIRTIFVVMTMLLSIAWATNAHADTVSAQMTIAPNGDVMIRGAQIESIAGDTAVVRLTWGKTVLRWSVMLTGSTRFVPSMSSTDAKAALKVGDPVSFTGEIDTLTSQPTIIASVFTDNALYQQSATLGGKVLSIDQRARNLVISNDAGTSTIALWSGSIVIRGGNRTTLGNISVGDQVSATGSLNLMTKTLSADRIDVSTPETASSGGGIFASILSWLTGTRGSALSVRDR